MKQESIFLQKMAKLYAQQSLDDLNLTPTDGMVAEAKRGLAWRKEFGRGGTAVGVARARDIQNKKTLSPDTVMRMNSFFARHEVNKKAQGFSPGEDGFPSNGRIAWALWGGDAGQSWASKMADRIRKMRESSELDLDDDYDKYDNYDLEEGDVVQFTINGNPATGMIEYVMEEGYFGIEGSRFYTPATPENPALLIRIWEDGEETEYMIGRMFNEVEKVEKV